MPTACVHVRVLLRDLGTAFTRYDAQQSRFCLRSSGVAFSNVRALGICTSATLAEQTCKLEIGASLSCHAACHNSKTFAQQWL